MAKRVKWIYGDVFGLPLKDGSFGIVQIIDSMMPNIIYIAVFNNRINNLDDPFDLVKSNIISLACVTRFCFGNGDFHKLYNHEPMAKKSEFANERFKNNHYVGAVTSDAEMIVDLLNAYHRLAPWDDWYDPNCLDEYLISPDVKPDNLIYIKN